MNPRFGAAPAHNTFHTACAVGYYLVPSGLAGKHLAGFVGQDGILRAGWQPAPGGHWQTPAGGLPTRRRLATCPTSRGKLVRNAG